MLYLLILLWLLNSLCGHIAPVHSQISKVFISDPYPDSNTQNYPNSKGLTYVTYNFPTGSDLGAMCHQGTHFNWTDTEANVVCRQNGYEGGLELGRLQLTYTDHHIITNMHCNGDESLLEDCSYDEPVYSVEGCGNLGYVGVSCYNEMDSTIYTDTSGVIKSPNFPLPYPSKAAYTYTIHIAGASEINIVFTSFRLEDGYDFLYLGSGTVPTSLQEAKFVFTGYKQPNEAEITLPADAVWIRFISDVENPRSIRNLQFSLRWEAKVIDLQTFTISTNSNNTPRSFTDQTVPTATLDRNTTLESNMRQLDTNGNTDLVVGISLGVGSCFVIIITIVVITLFCYKRRNKNKIESTNTRPRTGLAFNGPYDMTVQNSGSIFVGPNQTDESAMPHYNEAYQPDGVSEVPTLNDVTNTNVDGYDFVGTPDLLNNTPGAHIVNQSYNPDSNLSDNVYYDISDETNAYNYIDSGGLNDGVAQDAENIYEDTSSVRTQEAFDNDDCENDGIYAV